MVSCLTTKKNKNLRNDIHTFYLYKILDTIKMDLYNIYKII